MHSVPWRDLVPLSRLETVQELLLPLPWLLASLAAAVSPLYPIAPAFSFIFFLTGLRLVHGGCHFALGLSRRSTDAVLAVLSLLMLGSMHAVQWNHLRHHRDCLGPDDIEGMGARRSAWGAMLLGPRFPLRLHRAALTGAAATQRRWIVAELAGNVAMLSLACAPFAGAEFRYHLLAMAIGQCLTAFFAVWTVHHGCDPNDCTAGLARTIRNPLRNALTFNMFFHLEHHLFPQVPTAHLHILARRLDAAMPLMQWPKAW